VLTPPEARDVLNVLVMAVTQGSPDDREAGAALLSAMSGRVLVRLDDCARHGTWSSQAPVSGTRQWQNPRLGDETGLTAAVCSMHADGHLRERAVMILAGRPGTLRAALLALRCADHVPQVREAAQLGLAVHTEVAEADAALAVLVSMTERQHGPDALNGYIEAMITRHGQSVFPHLCSSRDMDTRRWAYRRCLESDLLPVSDLVQAARADPDQLIRSLSAEWLARTATPDVVRKMLLSRYVDGRLSALSHLPDDDLTDDEILAALVDRSARVRETAQWRARRRGIDPAAVYRLAAKTTLTAASQAGCLAGLSATGERSDLAAVETFLSDSRPSVRAAAVRAAGMLADPAEMSGLLGPRLLDPSPSVATAAAKALTRAPTAGVRDFVEAAWESEQVATRRAAWRLARSTGSWERVESDLHAATDEDPTLRQLGRTGVDNWLVTAAATTWRRPSAEQATTIGEYLAHDELDENVARVVAFHAGLPTRPRREADRPTASGSGAPEAGRTLGARLRSWFSSNPSE
jgi:HEAT repeats